jgi:hypothetical protein
MQPDEPHLRSIERLAVRVLALEARYIMDLQMVQTRLKYVEHLVTQLRTRRRPHKQGKRRAANDDTCSQATNHDPRHRGRPLSRLCP